MGAPWTCRNRDSRCRAFSATFSALRAGDVVQVSVLEGRRPVLDVPVQL